MMGGESYVLGKGNFSNSRLQDAFWTPTTYVGAFDGTNDWTAGWCEWDPENVAYSTTYTSTIGGATPTNITTNTTWTGTILLQGRVFVKAGATLTIAAGTLIRGTTVVAGQEPTIVVERNAQINAVGTAQNPIVFTSAGAPGNRNIGDIGGVILLGNAQINVPGGTAIIEGGLFGPGAVYGGGTSPNNADNSGTLQYVRLEFCGVDFGQGDEINSLTMGGIGSGTTIDHIQCSFGNDDAFEWFGGNVDCKYLVSYKTEDDDLDTDQGCLSRVQFALVIRDPGISNENVESRVLEADSDKNNVVHGNWTQHSRPLFSNISAFGPARAVNFPGIDPGHDGAAYFREYTECSVYNSFFAGFVNGFRMDGLTDPGLGTLQLEQVYLAGIASETFPSGSPAPVPGALESYFNTPANNNKVFCTESALSIVDPWAVPPNPQPRVGSVVFFLDNELRIGDDAALAVSPGTLIRCADDAAVVILQGAIYEGEGRTDAPIVYTSPNVAGPANRNSGDWGGFVMLGRAPINVTGGTALIEGGLGTSAVYGGTDANDNSGCMMYTRIEFAGLEVAPNDELNGLTMGGVGRGTKIEGVQVSFGDDDSFEWFGGTNDCKKLISFRGNDDDFDADQGYIGRVQFGLALRDPNIYNSSTSMGFEISSDTDSGNEFPTNPIFSNMTIALDPDNLPGGNTFQFAIWLKDETLGQFHNCNTFGFPTGLGFDPSVESLITGGGFGGNNVEVKCSYLADHVNLFQGTYEQNFFNTASNDNATLADYTQYGYPAPLNYTAPNYVLAASSPLRFRSCWMTKLTGTVTYANTAATPFANATVILDDGSKGTVQTATTNASGEFTIRYLPGSYTLTANTSNTWVPAPTGPVNSSDALEAQKDFLGTVTLTGLEASAADVNENGLIQSDDALNIQKRFLGLAVPSWSAPDFIFEEIGVTFNSGVGNSTSQNLKGIQSGDAATN
jgi:hypothetical protein